MQLSFTTQCPVFRLSSQGLDNFFSEPRLGLPTYLPSTPFTKAPFPRERDQPPTSLLREGVSMGNRRGGGFSRRALHRQQSRSTPSSQA